MVTINVVHIVIQLTLFVNVALCSEYYLKFASTAPAISGVNVTFYADLFKSDGTRPNVNVEWSWWLEDGNQQSLDTKSTHAEWNYTFPKRKEDKDVQTYRVHVSAGKTFLYITIPYAEAELNVEITSILNGELVLTQNGTVRATEYISSATPLNQTIQIKNADLASISNVSYVTVYWFVDCQYVGQSEQWNSTNFFEKENATHNIEALLVASFEPRPQPQPTTTTTTTTTTTSTTTSTTTTTTTTTTPSTTTSTSTSTTTPKPTTTTTTTPKPKRKRRDTKSQNYANQTAEMLVQNGEIDPKDLVNETSDLSTTTMSPSSTFLPYYNDLPYVCFNKSNVMADKKKIYGYFMKNVVVRNPLTSPVVSGSLWIKREDGMFLNISWSGSPPYEYCYKLMNVPLNMTANETCSDKEWQPIETSWITIRRYFYSEISFTILFQVRNQITNHTKIITINTYEVQKQAQLSVIVVPVAFMLCAIVAVIFGVAHYVQTRNRFSVEVADFNFGETSSLDLEYKSFVRRLYDSIKEALPQRGLTTENNETDDSSLRYGVMT